MDKFLLSYVYQWLLNMTRLLLIFSVFGRMPYCSTLNIGCNELTLSPVLNSTILFLPVILLMLSFIFKHIFIADFQMVFIFDSTFRTIVILTSFFSSNMIPEHYLKKKLSSVCSFRSMSKIRRSHTQVKNEYSMFCLLRGPLPKSDMFYCFLDSHVTNAARFHQYANRRQFNFPSDGKLSLNFI